MSKSALYAVNSTSQPIGAGEVISFGNPVRRFGCNCNVSGTNIVITGRGYYEIDTNFTIVASGAGTITIQFYKDGSVIPGASQSVSTEAATTYTMSIPAIVRLVCDCESTITAVLTGGTASLTNASMVVSKL